MLVGAGGNIRSSLGVIKTLSIGKKKVENVLAVTSDIFKTLGKMVSTEIHGILGYNFLSEFRIIVDYPDSILQFE